MSNSYENFKSLIEKKREKASHYFQIVERTMLMKRKLYVKKHSEKAINVSRCHRT